MSLTEEMIFPADINEEVRQSFLDYAVSVITDRSLPDVRDGLKPVHRRILYAMYDLKMWNSKPFVKAAKTVGEVLGSYHPHGDTSVYDAMVRLAQPFSLNYPVINWHGNMGNIDGDPAAHYRYTEARLSKIGEDMLKDIDKETVDWKDNFAEDRLEPVVLPARLPQLLINGTTGIAVGMACSFVPHNLGRTVNAIEAYIGNNQITHKELLDIVGGPDFPTGGLVINQDELLEGYSTGRGRVRIRGKYKLEKRNTKDLIVFYEIPYMTKKSNIVEKIAELAEAKDIEGITDVRDESARDMRLVIEVAKGFSPEAVAEVLFAKTQLENTYSLNNTCLVDGQPMTLSFKSLIDKYVEFQQDVLIRRTEFDLAKIVARIHIIEGLIIALAEIDKVIKVIRDSDSTEAARTLLQDKFVLTEIQAKSVLAMRLSSLTKLEVGELKNEKSNLEVKKAELDAILESEEVLNELLLTELKHIAKSYTVPKRSDITQITVEKAAREAITKIVEKVNVAVNSDSIVSFVTDKHFKTKANKEDSVYRIATNTGESLVVFVSSGLIYKIPIEDINQGDSLQRLLNINPKDKIVNILTDDKKEFILFLTKQGMIKKSCLSDYQNIKRTGVIGIKLREGDEVVSIDFVNDEPIIVLASNGYSIRFNTADITATSRNSMGVIAIKLPNGESAVDFATDSKDKLYFITVSKNGFVKKSDKKDYPIQGRNGKGVIGMKLADGDQAFAILEANESDNIILYGEGTLVKTMVIDISIFGRTSIGNGMVKEGKVNNVHKI